MVRDLELSLDCYERVVGMEERIRDSPMLALLKTPGSRKLVTLDEDPEEAPRRASAEGSRGEDCAKRTVKSGAFPAS